MIDYIQTMQQEISLLRAENKELKRKLEVIKKQFIDIVETTYNVAVANADASCKYAENYKIFRYETYENAGILDDI